MTVAVDALGPQLAHRVLAIGAGRLPTEVSAAARWHLLDAIGVGLAGSVASTTPLRGPLDGLGSGTGTVLGRCERLAPAAAALANGTFIHSLEFDDTHVPSVIHGSAVIVPAALAVAEACGASGSQLLSAVAAGWETLVALGLASPGGFQAAGFQTVAVAGPFGAAVAAGVLTGVDEATLAAALGVCGSQAAGTFAFLADGSTVKAMHAGWAAHAGVLAVELARAGVSGPARVLEDRSGFFACYARDPDAAGRLARSLPDLGRVWALPGAAFKAYPVCHYIHPFLEAAERLRSSGVAADDIASAHCRVPDGVASVICEPWNRKQAPISDHDARWSLPVCIAQMLAHGTLRSEDVAGIASDPELLSLAARTSWEPWPDSGFPARFPAVLEVTTSDGTRRCAEVDDVRGSARRPLATDEVQAKFLANAAPVLGEARADWLAALIDELDAVQDVRALCTLLRPRPDR